MTLIMVSMNTSQTLFWLSLAPELHNMWGTGRNTQYSHRSSADQRKQDDSSHDNPDNLSPGST